MKIRTINDENNIFHRRNWLYRRSFIAASTFTSTSLLRFLCEMTNLIKVYNQDRNASFALLPPSCLSFSTVRLSRGNPRKVEQLCRKSRIDYAAQTQKPVASVGRRKFPGDLIGSSRGFFRNRFAATLLRRPSPRIDKIIDMRRSRLR